MKTNLFFRLIWLVILGGVVSACSLGIPNPTPTVAPTPTPLPTQVSVQASPTQFFIATDTATPVIVPATNTNEPEPTASTTPLLPEPTDIPSDTPVPTVTRFLLPDEPTRTPTFTLTPSQTPTPTFTPSATNTPNPTATDTPVPTIPPPTALPPTAVPTNTTQPSQTPLPDTDTPVPTQTSIPDTNTPQPSTTPVPASSTPLPPPTNTLTLTPLPSLTPIPSPSITFTPTLLPTFTAAPTNLPTQIIQPLDFIPPTLAVTPTQITATPGGEATVPPNTPILSTPEEVPATATPTFTPAPTVDLNFVEQNTGIIVTAIAPTIPRFNPINTTAYRFSGVAGTGSVFGGRAQGDVVLFAQNPVFPESYMRVDTRGMLYLVPPGGSQEGTYTDAPYFDGFQIGSAAENKNFIAEIAWSPNGQHLAFRIAPNQATDTSNAGVWFWQPDRSLETDPSYTLLRDCPASNWNSCRSVSSSGIGNWQSSRMEWNPDSVSMLVTLNITSEGRQGLAVVGAVRSATYANNLPPVMRYDYGYWADGGQRILVSGKRADGTEIVGFVNPDGSGEQILFNASQQGLSVRDAVQRPNGQIVMLGSRWDDPSGRVALYDVNGNVLSDPIGDGRPQSVTWFPDRNGVVVVVNGQEYTVYVDSRAVTQTTVGNTGNIDPEALQPEPPPLPEGIVEGSQFAPGQQVQIAVNRLNVRDFPSVDTGNRVTQVSQGEYVAILAGPYTDAENSWWQIATANQQIGWIAAIIDGNLAITTN